MAVEVAIRTGNIDEGPDDISLSSVTADMLLEGTSSRTAQQISEQAAEMGGSISVRVNPEVTTIGGEVLSEFAPAFIALLGDVIRNPRFAGDDLKRILDKHARDNSIALATPQSQVMKKFYEIVFGSHPFSHTFPPEPMLRGFNVTRVQEFHSKNFGARRSEIYAGGVFDGKKMGGAFGSRITANIREDKGYTYSPGSFFITERKSAVWVEAADVTTGVTGPSLTEIFKEIDRVRHELPPDAELRGIETSLAGDFIIRNSSRFGVIRQLQFVDLHGLGAEYLSSYVKNLMAVTPEDVRATAQKYLAPERLSIAIVGDKKTVEPQLTKLKLVPSS